jgi:mannose-1-phosphate guanylyltransferase
VYSLMRVNRMDPQAVVGFFPSDHHFGDEAAFTDCVSRVFEAAQLRPHAVTLVGIAPDEPETGYGWIEPGEPLMASGPGILFSVRRFWEKPSKSLAIELMQRGCFWNSFIMVGRVEAFFELISRAAPSLVNCFRSIAPALGTENEAARVKECYQRIPSSSFSTDVLSACPDNLAVFCSKKLEWADVGEVNRALSVIAGAGQPETDRILTLAG